MTPEQQQRDLDTARLVLGEDAEELGSCYSDRSFLGSSDPRFCGKMAVLQLLLEVWHAEGATTKVLLFSYSTRTLDILENMIIRWTAPLFRPTENGFFLSSAAFPSHWWAGGLGALRLGSARCLGLFCRKGYSFERLDGSTSQKERQERVDHFNHSESCFVYGPIPLPRRVPDTPDHA